MPVYWYSLFTKYVADYHLHLLLFLTLID